MAKARASKFNKTHKLQVLVTESERDQIEAYATSQGVTVSAFMRQLALQHITQVCQPA